MIKQDIPDSQPSKQIKPATPVDLKDDNESRTSDSKRNTAQVLEASTAKDVLVQSGTKMGVTKKQDDSEENFNNSADLQAFDMKIQLPKHQQEAMARTPEKEDFIHNRVPEDVPLTNNYPEQPSKAASPPSRSRMNKHNIIDPTAEQRVPVDGNSINSLNEKLLGFQRKSEHVLMALGQCLNDATVYSIDKKVEMIKALWGTLSENNQSMLKTLMKNQFNIYLNHFDFTPGHRQPMSGNQMPKMSLRYIKPSIIEQLYQEMDMLV